MPSPSRRIDEFVDLEMTCDPSWLNVAASDVTSCLEGRPSEDLARDLRRCIATVYRVPVENVQLLENIDRALHALMRRANSPMVCLPPSSMATFVEQACWDAEVVKLVRGVDTSGGIDAESAADLPADGIVIADSPTDPLGSTLTSTDVVRLARACQLVVVDERYAAFSRSSLRGLASEFQNIMMLGSFEKWLGPEVATCGWTIAWPDLTEKYEISPTAIDSTALAATLAVTHEWRSNELKVRLARQERSRLYRLLRKFSFLDPLPSWGPFMCARVKVVPRSEVIRAFLERGIRVHAPDEHGLEDFLRISVGSRSAMERFRLALLEIGPDLLA